MASDATKSHIFQQLFSIKILTKISYRVTRDTHTPLRLFKHMHTTHSNTPSLSHTTPSLLVVCAELFVSFCHATICWTSTDVPRFANSHRLVACASWR